MPTITKKDFAAYLAHLAAEELAAATIEKYARDINAFTVWLADRAVTKETAILYKQTLAETRKATSVNPTIAALNSFFAFMNRDVRLKPLKIQQQTYRAKENELTRAEYEKLLNAAQSKGSERLFLVIQTICSTGIRVSELRYITLDAAESGEAEIMNKGKTRSVFLPGKLQTALSRYARENSIVSGCIFITRGGNPLDRSNIWSEMKKLCVRAGVPQSKVYPHNLRRLFARLFYSINNDVMKLADILGHSDVNTTRIYIMESGAEHRKRVERLGLVMD